MKLEYSNYRVVVVDNGSADDSIKYLMAWSLDGSRPVTQDGACTISETKRLVMIEYSKVDAERGGTDDGETTLLKTPSNRGLVLVNTYENLGFAGGCNLGIAYALKRSAEYVFLLNNDARVTPDTLSHLVKVAYDANAAMVGARLFKENFGLVQFAGSRWPAQLFGQGKLPRSSQIGEFWPSSYASGCALLLRHDFLELRFKQYGHFLDTRYFMYCEEVDLCLHGHLCGYQCVIARDAIVYHWDAASSGGPANPRSYYYLTRNRIFLANRWLSISWKLLFHIYYIPSRMTIFIIRIGRGQINAAKAIISGLVDGYSNISGKWEKHGIN